MIPFTPLLDKSVARSLVFTPIPAFRSVLVSLLRPLWHSEQGGKKLRQGGGAHPFSRTKVRTEHLIQHILDHPPGQKGSCFLISLAGHRDRFWPQQVRLPVSANGDNKFLFACRFPLFDSRQPLTANIRHMSLSREWLAARQISQIEQTKSISGPLSHFCPRPWDG